MHCENIKIDVNKIKSSEYRVKYWIEINFNYYHISRVEVFECNFHKVSSTYLQQKEEILISISHLYRYTWIRNYEKTSQCGEEYEGYFKSNTCSQCYYNLQVYGKFTNKNQFVE